MGTPIEPPDPPPIDPDCPCITPAIFSPAGAPRTCTPGPWPPCDEWASDKWDDYGYDPFAEITCESIWTGRYWFPFGMCYEYDPPDANFCRVNAQLIACWKTADGPPEPVHLSYIPQKVLFEYNMYSQAGTMYDENYNDDKTYSAKIANLKDATNILIKFDPALE